MRITAHEFVLQQQSLESIEVDHKVCKGSKSQRQVLGLQRQLPKRCEGKQMCNGASLRRQS